jgi:REP element-mobilizing transposase RayT
MIKYQYEPYFLTFTIVDWLDVFSRKHCRDIVMDSLKYCVAHKGLIVYSYIIMSNHMHLVAQAAEGSIGLSGLIRDFKRHTSKQITLWMISSKKESRRNWMLERFKSNANQTYRNDTFQVWKHGSKPKHLFNQEIFEQKVHYIHMNPVKAGLVRFSHDYLYSSAGNYAGREDNIMDVTIANS